jgi:hypothetical protein
MLFMPSLPVNTHRDATVLSGEGATTTMGEHCWDHNQTVPDQRLHWPA